MKADEAGVDQPDTVVSCGRAGPAKPKSVPPPLYISFVKFYVN